MSLKNELPQTAKIIKQALCIFSAPIVESSFSEINHIVNDRRSCLSALTVSAIQTIRYSIRAAGKPAELFPIGQYAKPSKLKNILKSLKSSFVNQRKSDTINKDEQEE